MTRKQALLAGLAMCAAGAWLAGPFGRFLVVFTLLLIVPGYLLDRALRVELPLGSYTRPVLWIGLSICAIALLYAWATPLGLVLTPAVLALLLAAATAAALFVSVWRSAPAGAAPPSSVQPARWPAAGSVLVGLFTFTLWLRFAQVAELALPAWVDSVHHALLIRVAAERGQAPYDLRPYLPVEQLPYHWGYHVLMAAAQQLAGITLPQVMLWGGQVLNGLHVLTVAALAISLWRRPGAGVGAGLVVGLLSMMPAYYVSWGRYTQLTGLLLLPPLAIACDAALRSATRGRWVAVAIVLAGLSIVHVRVLGLGVVLIVALALVWGMGAGWRLARAQLRSGALAGALAALLSAPWLALLVARQLPRIASNPARLVGDPGYTALSEALLWAGQNRLLIALALLVALWGVARRSGAAAVVVAWVAGMFILANVWFLSYLLPAVGAILLLIACDRRQIAIGLAGVALLLCNPALVRLPSLHLFPNDIVAISLFIPIGLLIGIGADWGYSWLRRALASAASARVFAATSLVALTLWGALVVQPPGGSVINRSTILATEDDLAAIAWAIEHTPPDARFLINATAWLRGTDRGVDGGWWLLPLAGRWVSTPPAVYIYGDPEYVRSVQERHAIVSELVPGQEQQIFDLIEREQITHVYLSDRSGPLRRELFADRAGFEIVYDQRGITILAVE